MAESRVQITLNHTVELEADGRVLTHRFERWSFVTERPGDGEEPRVLKEPCPHCEAVVSVKLWSEAAVTRNRWLYGLLTVAALAIAVVSLVTMVTGEIDAVFGVIMLLTGCVVAFAAFALARDVSDVIGGRAYWGDGSPAPFHMLESCKPMPGG